MADDHRTAVQRFFEEAFNAGNIRILPELIAPEHISHLPTGDHYGPEGVRIDIAGFRAAFPDLRLNLDEVIDTPETGTVCYRFTARGTHHGPFMGVAPTGRRIRVDGIGIDRFRDGKMIERWVQYDSVGLLQQLGALPGFCACAD
jgi:predicted ester cyclase